MDDVFAAWYQEQPHLEWPKTREELMRIAWNAAVAAAATYVDHKGMEGTANALADDLVSEVPGGGGG